MKKFFLLLFCLLFLTVPLSACEKKEPTLFDYVSEYRGQIYAYDCEDFSIKAYYGFKEENSAYDGNVSKRIYKLSFKMLNEKTENAEYILSLSYNGETYKTKFDFNPVKDALCAEIEIENFNEKSFPVVIYSGGKSTTVNLNSSVPENTIDVYGALSYLEKNQAELVNNYRDEYGNFTGEIHARILVKNNTPYWYIGLVNENKNLKALLIDGFNGNVLAVRDVF